jgi:RHS repeat-associated core domain
MKNQLKRHISISSLLLVMFCGGELDAQTPTNTQNYVIESTVKTSGKKNKAAVTALTLVDSINKVIQYYDGLGRRLQTVQWKASPAKRDLVTPIAYDAYGREDKKYLPYAATTATSIGSYKATAIADQNSFYTSPSGTTWTAPGVVVISGNNAVSKTIFEASPLNRVLEQGAPGAVWQPGIRTTTAGRSVVTSYSSNNSATAYATTGFAVRLYKATASTVAGSEHLRTLSGTTYYGANQLYLTITKDENWTGTPAGYEKLGTTEEYRDREGRLVLKRSFNLVGTTVQILSTYYVYDDLGNLSFVLPPGASPDGTTVPTQAVQDAVCYQYRYDGRKRLIQKKLPGKGWEDLIYNKLDQVVFTQDAIQAAAAPPGPHRSFIKYDGLGRVIMTGIEKGHTQTRAFIQNIVDTQPILWESRDNAGFQGYTNVSNPMNHPQFEVHTVNYYDDYTAPGIPNNQSASYSNKTRGLLTASKTLVLGSSNYLWTVNYYDEEGRVVKVWQQHYKGGVVATNSYDETTNTYNFAGELTKSVRRHFVAGVEKLNATNRFVYDHMGRLMDTYQKTGDVAATTNPEILLSRNTYNEIGQLRSKGLYSSNLTTPAFAQTVNYTYNPRGWLKSMSSPLFAEALTYELDSTGLIPQYNGNISRQKWGLNTSLNKQYIYTYDKLNRLLTALSHDGNDETIAYSLMGNITSLQRKSLTNVVDQLTYTYSGNILSSVADANGNTVASFQLPGTTTYGYDLNGNMITRVSTTSAANNMYDMTYNHLNLPTNINANGAVIVYTYDANGNKLRKIVSGSATVNNDYISGIHYEAGVLKFMATAEGRVVRNSATSYSYEYTLEDHLGNGRVYFDVNASNVAVKKQETDYYAFGLEIDRLVPSPKNLYLYNGKEKQEQEKLFDYGARFYDPVIARWNVLDPMAEDFDHVSPYNYAMNNPILMIDPDGMVADTTQKSGIVFPITIMLDEVVIEASRILGNGLKLLGAGVSATTAGVGTFFGAVLLPSNYHQKWQYRDYGLPQLPPPYIPINTDKDKDKDKDKEIAGSGTPRKKTTKQLRKEWEAGEGKPWPKDPDDPTQNQVAHHKKPLADGGYDGYPNITPMPRREHIKWHRENGDSARWGKRRQKE